MIIYEAESALRHPGRLLGAMAADLAGSRRLGWVLFVRDMQAQARESFFGVLSFFLPPLASAALLICLQHARAIGGDAPHSVSPALFVICGTIYWQLFVDLLTFPLRTVEKAKPLLVKLAFPREALVIAALLRAVANFALRFALLSLFFFPGFSQLALALLSALPLAGFGLLLGVFSVPCGLLFRDFAASLSVVTSFLLIFTPVGFFLADGAASPIYFRLNPLTYLVGLPRAFFLSLPNPAVAPAAAIGALSVASLFLAWVVFRTGLPHLTERLGT